ncbi:FG-GAP repeat protein [Streptomyces sp. T-3]|nr:FG-GAP repeat protein [Streptomyces sp. T-3]
MRRKRLSAVLLAATTVLAGAGLVGTAGSASAAGVAGPDLNGDGYADAVVGVGSAEVEGKKAAGFIHVLYGGENGLGNGGIIKYTQEFPGIPGTSEAGDRFGSSVVTADVDGDGRTDVVVGAPGETVGDGTSGKGHGSVVVLYGSSQEENGGYLGRGRTIVQGKAGDHAGASLSAGDFTRDGAVDVAVGATQGEFGRVSLRPGPLTEDKPLTQLLETGETVQLAAGDFDGDGGADLATASRVLGETSVTRTHLWRWNGSSLQEYGKHPAVGSSMAAGDFDGDGVDDLALGSCTDTAYTDRVEGDCGPDASAKGGKVRVLYGAGDDEGFGTRRHTFSQDTPGVAGTGEDGDHFGVKMAAGDLTGDGRDDLVVGAPGEAIGTVGHAGSATVLTSGQGGLLDASGTAKSVAWHQNSTGVPGAAEVNDEFGSAAAIGDYDGDGDGDAVIGAYNENSAEWEAGLNTGGVWTLPNGSGAGSKAYTARMLGLRGAMYYGQVLGL